MLLVPSVPPAAAASIPFSIVDRHWDAANSLAVAIENRSYGEIAAAARAIDPSSPYAPWVPAAVQLAIEQIDATASGYMRMNMCRELGRFIRQIEEEWPDGHAAMQPVSCGRFICGTYRQERIRAAGSIEAYRREREIEDAERYATLAGDLARAIANDDHRSALDACGEMREYGAIPASCLVQACRARELAVAEAIYEHLESETGVRFQNEPAYLARQACQRVGVAFFDGRAHVVPTRGPQLWHAHPVELVRVHPDAPAGD